MWTSFVHTKYKHTENTYIFMRWKKVKTITKVSRNYPFHVGKLNLWFVNLYLQFHGYRPMYNPHSKRKNSSLAPFIPWIPYFIYKKNTIKTTNRTIIHTQFQLCLFTFLIVVKKNYTPSNQFFFTNTHSYQHHSLTMKGSKI